MKYDFFQKVPGINPPLDFSVLQGGRASDVIGSALCVSEARATKLIELGAVYLNKIRMKENRILQERDVVRAHANPRRFATDAREWKRRILWVSDDFVIIDKPPEMPVHPTCDNSFENALAHTRRTVGGALWIVHRLDIATQGLIVFARTEHFRKTFLRALGEGLINKKYRTKVSSPPPLGKLVHYLEPEEKVGRKLSQTPRPGWQRCELEVVSRSYVNGSWHLLIHLITGRNHQIRRQLAAVGCPILGDPWYGSKSAPAFAPMFLQSCFISFPGRDNKPLSFAISRGC